jgi:hypothetical protein
MSFFIDIQPKEFDGLGPLHRSIDITIEQVGVADGFTSMPGDQDSPPRIENFPLLDSFAKGTC